MSRKLSDSLGVGGLVLGIDGPRFWWKADRRRRYVPGDSETLGTLELEYTGAIHVQKSNARREGF